MKTRLLVAMSLVALGWLAPRAATAAPIKPRFLVVVDTSGSMSGDSAGVETHGDGSNRHPGCDINSASTNGQPYDDSRLYQAKGALMDTFASFGQAEFALGRYRSTDVSQTCSVDGDCPTGDYSAGVRNWTCIDPSHVGGTTRYCAVNHGRGCDNNPYCYDECTCNGPCDTFAEEGCFNCASPANDAMDIYAKGLECGQAACNYNEANPGAGCMGADVLVPFPSGSPNYTNLLEWLDGAETYPAGTNRELRANGSTPNAAALGAAAYWLANSNSTAQAIGAGSGVRASDPQSSCRSYNVILVTDGGESCDVRDGDSGTGGTQTDRAMAGILAAKALFNAGVNVHVIGFAVSGAQLTVLNAIASAGKGQDCATRTFTSGEYNYTGCPTAAIIANNRADLTARLGDIIAGSIPPSVCDCNSTCDDEDTTFPTKGRSCTTEQLPLGKGRCKRTGVLGCNGAGNGVTCSVAGVGFCGLAPLTPGAAITEDCGTPQPCPAGLTPEECADEDCDGEIDEGLSCLCGAKPEICNGLDDNCNNMTDEIGSIACGLDLGECNPGTTACVNNGGFSIVCQNASGPNPESCDALDNDCDGVTDGFGRACYPAATMGCTQVGTAWSCNGICQTGVQICPANPSGATNAFGVCGGAITPRTEVPCDSIDNDCDGQTDEGFQLGQPCYPGNNAGCNINTGMCVGACRIGTFQCSGGAVLCQNTVFPTVELCNGVDDDCDGNTDIALGACGPALGECTAGQYQCQGINKVCVQPDGPVAETCNGLDDDCNGAIDDNLTEPQFQTDTPCSSSVGVCRQGVLRCIGGQSFCLGGISPQIEVCNNIDDDCDGCTDCDTPCLINIGKLMCPIPGSGQACGFNVGICTAGALLCVQGATMCVGATNPQTETCDAVDNDCNGFTDEADPGLGGRCYPGATGCNLAAGTCTGECKFGTNVCTPAMSGPGAALTCANPVGPIAEICDDKDNDCDGIPDEDFDVGVACNNGSAGKCYAEGTKICNGRGDGTTCSVMPPDISDEVCDGLDNDCDGKIDLEDTDKPLPGVGEPCGSNVGECRVGARECVLGKIVCSAKEPTLEICDGLDNDCDGSVDEDLMPPGAECIPGNLPAGAAIAGECRAGKFACAKGDNGVWGWQCREGVGPQAEICDGKDNDCDGVADQNAPCPTDYQCISGECVPKCQDGEFNCPADRICKDGYCVRNACVNITCNTGFYCDASGACVDRCAGVVCPTGASCENGLCLDCQTKGCPDGKICKVRTCEVDHCAAKTCEPGSYCKATGGVAACVKDCINVVCGSGQSCRDGLCVADACAAVACGDGQYCDPATVTCKESQCDTISARCLKGQRCIENTATCEVDPCLDVRCPGGSECRVGPDGFTSCARPPGTPGGTTKVERRVASSGGGGTTCACRIGAAEDPARDGVAGAWLLALGMGWFTLARVRGRRLSRRATARDGVACRKEVR